jgi:hypothetical protein
LNRQGNQLFLSARFTEAIEYARQHHTEFRKGTEIPYMAHLLGVAALVMGEAGSRVRVTEDMVIAALLHDVVEDHGGLTRLHEVEQRFGADVTRMVRGLSDSFTESQQPKDEWKKRKSEYIERLRSEPDDVLLISAADKLYNAKAILDEFNEIGEAVWERFKRGADQQLWYFDELLAIYLSRPRNRVVNDLERVVRDLTAVTLRPETDLTSATASVPTTMNICPKPERWQEVYETLTARYSEQAISKAPPKPLILAGWACSNDVEKADRWRETVLWAEQNGFSELTKIDSDDWYSVEQPSSYEIGPLGGPMAQCTYRGGSNQFGLPPQMRQNSRLLSLQRIGRGLQEHWLSTLVPPG